MNRGKEMKITGFALVFAMAVAWQLPAAWTAEKGEKAAEKVEKAADAREPILARDGKGRTFAISDCVPDSRDRSGAKADCVVEKMVCCGPVGGGWGFLVPASGCQERIRQGSCSSCNTPLPDGTCRAH